MSSLVRTSTVEFQEKLNLALALSASEAEQAQCGSEARHKLRQAERSSSGTQEEEDYRLALALHMSDVHDQNNVPTSNRQSTSATIEEQEDCADSKNNSLVNLGKLPWNFWRPKVLRCGVCDGEITGEFIVKNRKAYHKGCSSNIFKHEKCMVCHKYLPTEKGRIVWSEHPTWHDKFCREHSHDGTPKCTACDRLKPQGSPWITLEDGRNLCKNCQETIVVDSEDCQPLYDEIIEDFKEMGLILPEKPRLALVDASALNDYSSSHEGHGGCGSSQTRGMTLTEEHTSIKRVVRRNGFRWRVLPEMVPVKSRHCFVSAILVLYGLPRLVTGSIVAHETMHAWLKLNHITGLKPEVEEGLCQLMALIWLEKQTLKETTEQQLAAFVKNQIWVHPSPIYGGGFRAAHQSYQQYGLHALIDHIRQTYEFPVPSSPG